MGSASIVWMLWMVGDVGSSMQSMPAHTPAQRCASARRRYWAAKASAARGLAPPSVISRVTGKTDSGCASMKARMAW